MLIGTYRQQLDTIDLELLRLFQSRMDVVKDIATYKTENNIPIYHPNREKEILEKMALLANPKYREYIKDFFVEILRLSKDLQNQLIEK